MEMLRSVDAHGGPKNPTTQLKLTLLLGMCLVDDVLKHSARGIKGGLHCCCVVGLLLRVALLLWGVLLLWVVLLLCGRIVCRLYPRRLYGSMCVGRVLVLICCTTTS